MPIKPYYLNLRDSIFMVHPKQKHLTEVYKFKQNKELINLADLPYHRTQTCFLVSIFNEEEIVFFGEYKTKYIQWD